MGCGLLIELQNYMLSLFRPSDIVERQGLWCGYKLPSGNSSLLIHHRLQVLAAIPIGFHSCIWLTVLLNELSVKSFSLHLTECTF
jgi:hypothetical protein